MGQHLFVCNLLAGIFHERTPQPRYQQIWDVNLVLTYFQNSKSDNISLSDKHFIDLKVSNAFSINFYWTVI